MMRDDYLSLLVKAAASDHGIALPFRNWHHAVQARRKFYRLRDELREDEAEDYRSLSFFVTYEGDLHIIRRDVLPRRVDDDGLTTQARNLDKAEAPAYAFNVSARKPFDSTAFQRFFVPATGNMPNRMTTSTRRRYDD